MTKTLPCSLVPCLNQTSLNTNVVVFPDGSVMWESPQDTEQPLPYAGYELPVRGNRPTPSRKATTKTNLQLVRPWMVAGGAIALLLVSMGMAISRFATPSVAISFDAQIYPSVENRTTRA